MLTITPTTWSFEREAGLGAWQPLSNNAATSVKVKKMVGVLIFMVITHYNSPASWECKGLDSLVGLDTYLHLDRGCHRRLAAEHPGSDREEYNGAAQDHTDIKQLA